jgi:hypothetical protein
MRTSRRKKIPADIETQVLVACRRRCCICVFVNSVLAPRPGQLAHIDRNPSNNSLDNLAWLCMEHHDAYDSRTSQSKGLTAGEVRKYRDDLHSLVAQTEQPVLLAKLDPAGESTALVSSGNLLGRIIEAYDREAKGLEVGTRPNGIALAHLATIATTEAGDFTAAMEALLFLLRLAAGSQARNDPFPTAPTGTVASPLTACARMLRTFAVTDSQLLAQALERARDFVLAGDKPFRELHLDDSLPHASFAPLVLSLCLALRREEDAQYQWITTALAKALGRLLMTSAMLLVLRGSNIPSPPDEILIDVSGRRRVPEKGEPATELFVWTAHQIANLSQSAYELTVKEISFFLAIQDVAVDESSGTALPEVPEIIRRWALRTTSFAITWLNVRSDEDATSVRRDLDAVKALGRRAADQARQFVANERHLMEGGAARIAGTDVKVRW